MPLELPRARGALDHFARGDDGAMMLLRGWLGHPEHALDGAIVHVDGSEFGRCTLTRREDLANIWPHVPTTHRSGFEVRGVAPPSSGTNAVRTITIEGTSAGRAVVAFRTHRRAAEHNLATPHPDLLQRVTNNRDPAAFAQIGLDAAMDLLREIEVHRELIKVHRVLDWGCGPGRVAVQLANLVPQIEIVGCDLDAEAVAWCNQHLRAGAFHVTNPFPPLPFPDQSFDAIVAVSVMSHLDWPVQRRWLAEIRRVLRPGGIFAASVHGPFAAAFFPGQRERLLASGFIADEADKNLKGIAPRGYYRAAFQTPTFTREHWSKHLAVVAHHAAGLAGFQDLVICRA
jgi:SAM-dependent methyltransferase